MDPIIKELSNFGALGIICGILLTYVIYVSKKLFSVIENNTKAITELKSIIETKCRAGL